MMILEYGTSNCCLKIAVVADVADVAVVATVAAVVVVVRKSSEYVSSPDNIS